MSYHGTMADVWNTSTKSSKKKLLKAYGLHTSFSEVELYEDLPKRSGGFVVRELDKAFQYGRKKGRY